MTRKLDFTIRLMQVTSKLMCLHFKMAFIETSFQTFLIAVLEDYTITYDTLF